MGQLPHWRSEIKIEHIKEKSSSKWGEQKQDILDKPPTFYNTMWEWQESFVKLKKPSELNLLLHIQEKEIAIKNYQVQIFYKLSTR